LFKDIIQKIANIEMSFWAPTIFTPGQMSSVIKLVKRVCNAKLLFKFYGSNVLLIFKKE